MAKRSDARPPECLDATRREFVRSWLATTVALGVGPLLSSACEAVGRSGGEPQTPAGLAVLTAHEAAIFDAWCDQLAPGAAEAGVSRFVDFHLAAPRAEALLFSRMLANPPFVEFYRQGIAGIEEETEARFGSNTSYVDLDDARQQQVVEAAVTGTTVAWPPPSASLFFFVSRSDAVDVAFGTEAGFRRLHIPYLAHIRPASPW